MEGLTISKAYENNGALCLLMSNGVTYVISPELKKVDSHTYQSVFNINTIPAPAQPAPANVEEA